MMLLGGSVCQFVFSNFCNAVEGLINFQTTTTTTTGTLADLASIHLQGSNDNYRWMLTVLMLVLQNRLLQRKHLSIAMGGRGRERDKKQAKSSRDKSSVPFWWMYMVAFTIGIIA
jgi:hypothetical protein